VDWGSECEGVLGESASTLTSDLSETGFFASYILEDLSSFVGLLAASDCDGTSESSPSVAVPKQCNAEPTTPRRVSSVKIHSKRTEILRIGSVVGGNHHMLSGSREWS
jgi:hypothetical protein